ncbi:NUDIX domain-containing protein [Streptomyces sp. NBC_01378]|uniref:NUDIX domain-containing protein n=1 Tax=Streptomyces sp. NBC_01378 TaxID=2903844 RepID=UPI003868C229
MGPSRRDGRSKRAPPDAARRELAEKLGLTLTSLRLLVVDWVAPYGPWDDQIAFIFDGGTLTNDNGKLSPRDGELATAEVTAPNIARARLGDHIRPRFTAALEAAADGRPRYLHNGTPAADADQRQPVSHRNRHAHRQPSPCVVSPRRGHFTRHAS